MAGQVRKNNDGQYEADQKALAAATDAAYWAAKITRSEHEAWRAVRAAEAMVQESHCERAVFAAHGRKLWRLFGQTSLGTLRRTHGKHPAVLAAIRSAHRAAGITDEQRAAHKRVSDVYHGGAGVFEPHAEELRRRFGTPIRAEASKRSAKKWVAYFDGAATKEKKQGRKEDEQLLKVEAAQFAKGSGRETAHQSER